MLDLDKFEGFTPGPWRYPGTGNFVGGANRVRVADCHAELPPAERQANAALIAAAPDLLARVRELEAVLRELVIHADALLSIAVGSPAFIAGAGYRGYAGELGAQCGVADAINKAHGLVYPA